MRHGLGLGGQRLVPGDQQAFAHHGGERGNAGDTVYLVKEILQRAQIMDERFDRPALFGQRFPPGGGQMAMDQHQVDIGGRRRLPTRNGAGDQCAAGVGKAGVCDEFGDDLGGGAHAGLFNLVMAIT
nr:hypothetical protein [Chromobacterium alticapitis]